jgi:hypothetical protein
MLEFARLELEASGFLNTEENTHYGADFPRG